MRRRQDDNKIYEAAIKQFAQKGYKKTTLLDIAEELNMTNANLYSYASSKQALYHDAVAYAMNKWQNYVKNAVAKAAEPIDQINALFDSAITYLSSDKDFCSILKNDPEIFPMFPNVDPFEEVNKLSLEMLESVLYNGIKKGVFADIEVPRAAHILFAIYKALIIEGYILSEDDNFLKTYYETKNILLHGILKK